MQNVEASGYNENGQNQIAATFRVSETSPEVTYRNARLGDLGALLELIKVRKSPT